MILDIEDSEFDLELEKSMGATEVGEREKELKTWYLALKKKRYQQNMGTYYDSAEHQ